MNSGCPKTPFFSPKVRKPFLFFAISLFAAPAMAAEIFFAQTSAGLNTGADCADAYAYTDPTYGINGSQTASWVAGNTLHLCGTITGAAGATAVAVNGSGTSGHPITIKFENNAVLAAPYWLGAIVNIGRSYITIDGGANGLIENTENGTGLTYNSYSYGIISNGNGTSTGLIIKNLTIANICQHTSASDSYGCQTGGVTDAGMTLGIQNGGMTNVLITSNTIHDTLTGIQYNGGLADSGIVISSNTFYRVNWGMGIGNGVSTGLVVTGNDISCVVGAPCNWNDNSDAFHHNGIMIDPSIPGSLFQNMVISNNFIHDFNTCTAGIYFDATVEAIYNAQIYNNVFYTTPGQSGPSNEWTGEVGLAVNNTVIGPANAGIGGGGPGSTIENNIISTVGLGIFVVFPTSSFAGMTSDYNDLYNLTGGIYATMCADNPGYNCYATVYGWTLFTGFDVHSSTANPNLTASFTPNAGSPVIGGGINMTSYCSVIPGLCLDRNGSQRPMCGSWDIGAYQYCTSNCNTATCAPAFVAQPVSQTVNVGQTATFTVLAIGNPLPTYQWYKNGTAISGANAFTYTTAAATADDNGAIFDCVLSGSVTSSTATLTVTGGPPTPSTAAVAGLNAALVYPDPATPPNDPTIRVCPGGPATGGADIGVTIFDVSGRAVNSSDAFTFIGVPAQGVGAAQQFQCYEYKWTGHKTSGVYYAAVHAKVSGTTVRAKLKFAVVQ